MDHEYNQKCMCCGKDIDDGFHLCPECTEIGKGDNNAYNTYLS